MSTTKKASPRVALWRSGSPLRLRNCKWENSCDNCTHQEGRHYCLFWSVQIRDMDIRRCSSFDERPHREIISKANVSGQPRAEDGR